MRRTAAYGPRSLVCCSRPIAGVPDRLVLSTLNSPCSEFEASADAAQVLTAAPSPLLRVVLQSAIEVTQRGCQAALQLPARLVG